VVPTAKSGFAKVPQTPLPKHCARAAQKGQYDEKLEQLVMHDDDRDYTKPYHRCMSWGDEYHCGIE
jgi:hypothetical protein